MKKSAIVSRKKFSKRRRRNLAVLGATGLIGGAALLWAVGLTGGAPASATEVQVFKSPYCGCCEQWSRHLRANGFAVSVRNVEDMTSVKVSNGVPPELASCHTALVDGYVAEGHVPADVIRRLLREHPDAIGVSVPGMPSSAPGMDQPTGEPYNVVMFYNNRRTAIYASR